MTGNVWFVAGATSGFGKAIAVEALARGDKVIATARTATKRLGELEKQGALVLDLDVTASDDAIRAALQRGIEKFGKITHCVNAPGYVLEGPVEGASSQDVRDSFDVNVVGIINLSRLQAAILRPQGRGVIANFGSMAGWVGSPATSIYSAGKAAVSIFTEGLHQELKPFGVTAVAIEPGAFRTEFLNAGGSNRRFVADSLTEEYKGTIVEQVSNMVGQMNNNQAGDVVKGSKVIVDLLTGTGAARGREVPPRLLLGKDAVGYVRETMRNAEKTIQAWEDIITTTDHDDVKTG